MTACPKTPHLRDEKYRASFGKFHEHKCLLTGVEFTEFGSESIDGAHITIGRYGRGMKTSDDLILPLRHSLHLLFDKNQKAFIETNFEKFGPARLFLATGRVGIDDKVEVIKEIARQYYKTWKAKQ